MQALKTRRTTSTLRKIAGQRTTRQGIVRKPQKGNAQVSSVWSNGISSLKLKPLRVTDVLQHFESEKSDLTKRFNELYPAYQTFIKLMGEVPMKLEDVSDAVRLMHQHIESVLEPGIEFGIYYDDYEKRNHFVIKKEVPVKQQYNVFFYRATAKMLLEKGSRPYYHLWHKILRSLSCMGVMFWNDIQDYPIEWIMENNEQDDADPGDIRANTSIIKDYLSGDANKAIVRILKYNKLSSDDMVMIDNKLDPNHPICRMAKDTFDLLTQNKNIGDYSEEPDDDTETDLRFYAQFCIYFDDDYIFEMHNEWIEHEAGKGVQTPRVVTKLTADMEVLPDYNDPFPKNITTLFENHNPFHHITKYKESL